MHFIIYLMVWCHSLSYLSLFSWNSLYQIPIRVSGRWAGRGPAQKGAFARPISCGSHARIFRNEFTKNVGSWVRGKLCSFGKLFFRGKKPSLVLLIYSAESAVHCGFLGSLPRLNLPTNFPFSFLDFPLLLCSFSFGVIRMPDSSSDRSDSGTFQKPSSPYHDGSDEAKRLPFKSFESGFMRQCSSRGKSPKSAVQVIVLTQFFYRSVIEKYQDGSVLIRWLCQIIMSFDPTILQESTS